MAGRKFSTATDADLDLAAQIISRGAEPSAQCVFLRDKKLLFNDERTAFIMYGVVRCSWISAGDPIGPPEAMSSLIARFGRDARRAGSYPGFYKVATTNLAAYLENHFIIGKIGESASIPVESFGMDGPSKRRLRRSVKHAAGGLHFEVLSEGPLRNAIPALRQVSDAWLTAKSTREKQFSLGSFDTEYIARFPVAVVFANSQPVAFATLWQSSDRREIEIDLMRFSNAAPAGVMHYLVVELVSWARENGIAHVGLGMAPLAGSGMAGNNLGWVTSLVRRCMRRFYNFEGLRDFKQSFDPVWTDRYLATSPGITRRVASAHVAALTSGGVAGIFRK